MINDLISMVFDHFDMKFQISKSGKTLDQDILDFAFFFLGLAFPETESAMATACFWG